MSAAVLLQTWQIADLCVEKDLDLANWERAGHHQHMDSTRALAGLCSILLLM